LGSSVRWRVYDLGVSVRWHVPWALKHLSKGKSKDKTTYVLRAANAYEAAAWCERMKTGIARAHANMAPQEFAD
jgi:hypothetical protein